MNKTSSLLVVKVIVSVHKTCFEGAPRVVKSTKSCLAEANQITEEWNLMSLNLVYLISSMNGRTFNCNLDRHAVFKDICQALC